MMTAIFEESLIADTDAANSNISMEPKSIISMPSPSLTPCHLSIIDTFPWMDEFIKLCHEDMIKANIRSLEKLMNFYHINVIESVKECYSEPNRVTKLKRSMSEVLIFFYLSYSELKLPLNSSTFQAQMSDLMALYLDMEIVASRSGTESLQNIASKITSCLFIYFGCSHAHILDTILKSKMINRDSWELSDLIFRRVLRDSPGSSVDMITYMRHLLAFKLWKGIMDSVEERKKIQLMAEHQLIPPSDLKEKLSWSSVFRDIFPIISESETNITRFVLDSKFTIRDKIEMFLKAVADPKLPCAPDRDSESLASTNHSYIPDGKDDEHNWLMDDWSKINAESDTEDSLLSNKINDGFDNENLSNPTVRSISKNELEKKWMPVEMAFEGIGKDETSFKTVEIENIFKKDQIYQDNSFWEGGIMDVATEVELPSSPLNVTDIPCTKLEPYSSQLKENVVNPCDISNTHPHENYNDFDLKSEFIVENTPGQAMIFNLQNNPQFYLNKEQIFDASSNVEDHCSTHGFGLINSEQIITDSKSIETPRAKSIVNKKYFPVTINIPFEKHISGTLCEEQNEEVSSEEHNEELSSEEHNEELSSEEHNEELSSEEHNEESSSEEINQDLCIEEDNEDLSLEEFTEELSLEEFNKEEVDLREFNEDCINQRSSEEFDGKRHFEEHVTEKTIESSNVEIPSEQSEETPPEKRGIVHDFTLKNDNKIYKFHVKLSSYWEKLNRRTWISLLFPLFSEQDIKTPRCNCFICTQNYNTIMKNWKSAVTNLSRLPRDVYDTEIFSGNFENSILKDMKELLETDGLKLLVWEPEMDEVYTKIEELIKEENMHSNLPLKKRKAFSFKTYIKDEEKEVSYPNIPMISIAEVELAKEKYIFSTMNMNLPSTCNAIPPPLNYMPDYLSHPDYPYPTDIECDDVMLQSNMTNISTDLNPVLDAFTTTFIPEPQEQNRPKFKTPAQLKEFQHLSAAEALINFSLTSRSYSNENQEPGRENESEKRKLEQKTKSYRKRKRII
ncbi:unnamed protein product [Nezara viridula]|uniref:Uncharacterized protein n=1 Tax=Nezara viridula TaxID=85310 RepID=A0A9P0E3W7_NEZVI|nr:unnamed protein product [Nezara viridula]